MLSKEEDSLLYEFKIGSRAGKCQKVIGLSQDAQDLSHPGYLGLTMTMSKEYNFHVKCRK